MSEAPRILLLGKNGQVGWELQRSLAPLGTLVALDRHGLPQAGQAAGQGEPALTGDLSDLDGLRTTVRALRPDVIVNAAAHTAVDKAESEPALATRLNAEAPAMLAQEARALGALLVHYSTDYVFDGSGERPWSEDDATGPLGVYGATKRVGEDAITASGCAHLIFRTSWVYAARGGNFAKTMLRLAQEREEMTVINDQFGAPTGAELIADVSAQAVARWWRETAPAREALHGTYHLAAAGVTTWFDYAEHVLARARLWQPERPLTVQRVRPVPTSAFPTPARRPHNSRLDTSKLQAQFGLRLPPWQDGVDRMLSEVLGR